jgi:hypothetical protein
MTNRGNQRYVLIETENPTHTRQWLCRELFFQETANGDLCNGDCTLRLMQGTGPTDEAPPTNAYYTGLAHVALAACELEPALAYCKARGLTLQTSQGSGFWNPGVFGQGERYFNILTPFGLVVEVAQRVGSPCARGPSCICGLDHLGIPCADFEAELETLRQRGFTPLFAPVLNHTGAEGRIICCMVSDGRLTLEVYRFLDQNPLPVGNNTPLRGIGGYPAGITPGGLRFVAEGEAP